MRGVQVKDTLGARKRVVGSDTEKASWGQLVKELVCYTKIWASFLERNTRGFHG